jgi:hypothetical protein
MLLFFFSFSVSFSFYFNLSVCIFIMGELYKKNGRKLVLQSSGNFFFLTFMLVFRGGGEYVKHWI